MDAQNRQILAALQKGRELSALDALQEFGCIRLAARIYDLKRQGYAIEKRTAVKDGKRFALYRLKKK